jgi:Ca-activated chloride channel family protein
MYSTTAQINLLDQSGMPTETDVEVTLHDAQTGERMANFVHALRAGGIPDTLQLDPSVTYDMVVHTTPRVEVRNIELTAGKHNIIAAQTPQGVLVLMTAGSYDAGLVQCVLREAGSPQILEVQNLNSKRKYLVGNYDIEVLTLPKLEFKDVRIANGKESEIVIPEAGTLQLKTVGPGMLSIMMTVQGKPQKVYEAELASSLSLKMQPGEYDVIFRTSVIRSARLTQVKRVKIGPRGNALVQF